MNVQMLLADKAEVVNGKIYMLGGGWDQIMKVEPTVTFTLVVLVTVDWNKANQKMKLRVPLQTADGQVVEIEGRELVAEGDLELGRPPGVAPGSNLNAPLAIDFKGVPLDGGSYCFVAEIDGTELARWPFTVRTPEGAHL